MHKIEVKADKVKDAISKISGNTSPLMTAIAEVLVSSTEQNFEDERDPNTGQPWEALSEAYKEKKKEQGYSEKLLEHDGLLKASVHGESTRKKAMAATNLVYAAVHQFGYEKQGIPARPYFGLDDIAVDEILDAIDDHYSKAILSKRI